MLQEQSSQTKFSRYYVPLVGSITDFSMDGHMNDEIWNHCLTRGVLYAHRFATGYCIGRDGH